MGEAATETADLADTRCGQPMTPKTPPAQVIGVSDSCFDSSY